MELKENIYEKLHKSNLFNLDVKTAILSITKMFNISNNQVIEAFKQLAQEQRIQIDKSTKILKDLGMTQTGIFSQTKSKYGFVKIDGHDYLVRKANGVMNNDKVETIFVKNQGKKECVILKVIERNTNIILGQVAKNEKSYVFVPDDLNLSFNFILKQDELAKEALGKKVAFQVEHYENSSFSNICFGNVSKIFGKAGDPIVENQAIAFEHGFVKDFPSDVEQEVKEIKETISPQELNKRTDLRDIPFVTIDPVGCKDKDDAVYVEKTNNGFKAYVAIADVAHYVKQNTSIDREAYNRGTSCYLGDGVYPMLPEKLSNGICSLNEGVDRLALTAIVDVDMQGEIKNYDIVKSVIKIKHCLAYETAEDIHFSKKLAEVKYYDIKKQIDLLYDINEVLTQNREKRGSLKFVSNEPTFKFDETRTNVIEVVDKSNLLSKKVIESLMVLANEAVGKFCLDKDLPTLFRTHEEPNAEKLENISKILEIFGISYDGDCSSEGLQRLLEEIKGKPASDFLNDIVLRSMSKAKYQPENIGHYGLGSQNYIHFTSPIRRYPDTLVHRILHYYIDTKKPLYSTEDLSIMGCHLSDREGNADSAERISDNLLTVIWAENHVNEPFKCRVYGFDKNHLRIKYGLVEFRLPYNELPDSNLGFKTNETRTCMKSLQNGKTYKIGDEIIVKILFTDRSSRSIITTTDLNKVYSKTKPEILKAPLESSPIKADAKKKYYKLMDATCKQKSKSKRKNKHKSNKQRKDDEYSF